MLEIASDDVDIIEPGYVIIVRPEPFYLTEEEDRNNEEIFEQEVNDVPGLLKRHSVKKIRSGS